MDAVEVDTYPLDLAPQLPRLTGSDGFGRVRVSVGGAGESSSLSQIKVNVLEQTSWDRVQETKLCQDDGQLSFPSEDMSKPLPCSCRSGPACASAAEEVHPHRKAGKVPRSISGCSKRPRLSPLEDVPFLIGADDGKYLFDKYPSGKQRNNFSGKRGDRMNLKVCTKMKFDCFSVKAGLASCGSAAGGSNFFGLYGLKTDVQDITKLVDDISLNDLLDGSYMCPSLGKHRGKKAGNVAEDILHLVRKACSISQLPKPAKSENPVEMDGSCNEKIGACPSNSVSNLANGDSSATDACLSNQDTCSKPESPFISLDFPLEQPITIWERLALSSPKDLESLLLDAAKLAVHTRNAPDPRPGKNICRQASLPAFSWSHAFSGHTKSNTDGVKCLASRSTCQGGWVRITNIASSPKVASDFLMDLDSLTYDKSLVPICGPKLPMPQHDKSIRESVSWYELNSSEMAVASISSQFSLESGVDTKYQARVENCPTLLAAARTLCDIATQSMKIDQDGTPSWPKKLSEKSMKARRSAPNDKPEEITAGPSTSSMRNFERNGWDDVLCKRSKLSTVQSKKVLGHVNPIRRGPISWSTPKSARSSPNKSVDFIEEARNSAACILKRAMPPPPAKDISRKNGGQKRVRKLMQIDWNREFDGQG